MTKEDWSTLKKSLMTEDAPIDLVITKNAGRGLIATRTVEPNEVIFEEASIITGPNMNVGIISSRNSENYLFCCGCSTSVSPISVRECPNNCGLVFCREICNKRRWHSTAECNQIKESNNLQSHPGSQYLNIHQFSNWLLILRCILLRDLSPESWKMIQLLEDHSEEDSYKKQHLKNYEDNVVKPLLRLFPELASRLKEKQILKMCAKLDSNSFRQGESSRALFSVASMLNHSCIPNARIIFDKNGNAKVLSKSRIHKGVEISITYCSPLLGTWARREKLKANKFFDCSCERCEDPTEFGTFMSAMKCSKCPGYMLPDIGFCSRDENNIWSCNKCNFQTTEAKVSKLLSSIENRITKISRQPNSTMKLEDLFLMLSDKYLTNNHYLLQELKWNLLSRYEQNKKNNDKDALKRSIFLLDERITVLKAVDKNGSNISRLLGFLQFRKHCALMKLVNQLITGGRNETESIDSFKEDLTNSLNEAWMILEHDSGCPDELTSIISLLNT